MDMDKNIEDIMEQLRKIEISVEGTDQCEATDKLTDAVKKWRRVFHKYFQKYQAKYKLVKLITDYELKLNEMQIDIELENRKIQKIIKDLQNYEKPVTKYSK